LAGALRGLAPAEGGSGKAEGFGAWGETSPLLIGGRHRFRLAPKRKRCLTPNLKDYIP